MTTRADIAAKALYYNGLNDGTGYPGPLNIFEEELLRPAEFWCGDFVAAIFKMCNLPLPIMQAGMETGFASVPLGWFYAQSRGATVQSGEAQVADIAVFSNNVAQLGHVEIVTGIVGTTLYTIGGDSGPSNIDGFWGAGGVHRHQSYIQPGVGNPQIVGIIQTGQFVKFATPPTLEAPMLIEVTSAPTGEFTIGSCWEYTPSATFNEQGVGTVQRLLDHVATPEQFAVLKGLYGGANLMAGTKLAADVATLKITVVGLQPS